MIFIATTGSTSGGCGYPKPQVQGIERRVDARCPYCFEGIKGRSDLSSCQHCWTIQHNACWSEALNQCAACKRLRPGVPPVITSLESQFWTAWSGRLSSLVLLVLVSTLTLIFFIRGWWAEGLAITVACVPLLLMIFMFTGKEKRKRELDLSTAQQRFAELQALQEIKQTEEAPCGKHPKRELA